MPRSPPIQFECEDVESKRNQVFKFQMLDILKAMDAAAKVMKDQKDILLIDLDNEGERKIMTKDQVDKATKAH
jgi:hypothetical protein